ncbi:TetR/AcrR family transcriptional regulator [Streptomyces sp. 4N509B]|uniref:TetR/AcrR family transcriptional regulator n=1 Tax=Streptomyces sp. 4N509B TaxID=3457413 RepID=UPI003FD37015
MARRHDPDRRQRIIDAAVRLIAREGLAALSHRAVAAEADVPLGSTTYHFADRDELLLAALSQVNDAWLARFEDWLAGVDPAAPLAAEIARLTRESLTTHRASTEIEYELYVAGLRHPAVRPLAAACLDAMAAALLRHRLVPDEATARAVLALADGLTIQLLLTGRPSDPAQVTDAFARLLPGPGSPREAATD